MASSMSFLALPLEIRNQIYSYMTPINSHPKDYAGLFLSCKQIGTEMDGEPVWHMNRFIDRIEAGWAAMGVIPAHIPRPQRFADMQHFTIQFPRSLRPKIGSVWLSGMPCLRPVYLLHLESLTLDLYDDAAAAQLQPFEANSAELMNFLWGVSRLFDRPYIFPCPDDYTILKAGEKYGARKLVVGCGSRVTPQGAEMFISFASELIARQGISVKVLDPRLGRMCFAIAADWNRWHGFLSGIRGEVSGH